MPTAKEIFEGVREDLVDTLGVDFDEVTQTAHIVDDLGAESIDFLDLVFRLEKRFKVKIPRGEFFPIEGFFDNPDCVGTTPDSPITADGLRRLKELLPWTDVRPLLGTDPRREDVRKLITVQFVCDFVVWKLALLKPAP